MIMISSIISELLIFVFDLFGSVSEQVAQGSYHSGSTFTGTISLLKIAAYQPSELQAVVMMGSSVSCLIRRLS